jgi:fructoselysine-6-P-deglycase FrlB-like protein
VECVVPSEKTLNTGLPLRPIEPDFVPTLRGVLEKQALTRRIARDAIREGVTDIVFVGCGGSYSSSIHAATLLEARSTRLTIRNINAAEFQALPPARLGLKMLVVASSHSGGTPETVAAAKFARERGARLVAVSRDDDNPLVHASHYSLSYGSERTVTSAKQMLLAQLSHALLEETGAPVDPATRTAYEALPTALLEVQEQADPRLAEIARRLSAERPTYVVSSGPSMGSAFSLSLCYFMEMQWMNASNIDAGDYLHGPFEMLTENASLIVFQGEDAARPLTERVIRFAERHGTHVFVIDSREFPLTGVPEHLRGDVSAIALGVLGTRLADHREAATGHSLDERRYMHKVEY